MDARMTNCLHCGATTSNGLALCELSKAAARTYLTEVPVYFRNLARERRPGRPNGTLGASGQWLIKRGEADPSVIPPVLAKVINDLTTWARTLTDDRGIEPPEWADETQMVVVLCVWFDQHLGSIATLEWAGQFVRDMAKHEKALRQVSDDVVPGWYAGACRQPAGRDMDGNEHTCGADIHVMPGLTWVTCSRCGATTHAADHLPVILEEARDWRAQPKALAEAIVALVESEESVPRLRERIKKWGQRGRIDSLVRVERTHVYDLAAQDIVVADVEVKVPRFRLGDVMDRLHAEGQTREMPDAAAKVS
jgi:hypothetical protein